MSSQPRRRRCSRCSKAKEADDFSPPQLKALETERLCIECEKTAAAAARLAAEQEASVSAQRGRSPARGQQTPGGQQVLRSPGGLTTPGSSGNSNFVVSPVRARPNQELSIPVKFTGPDKSPERGTFCIVCKSSKHEFSATMAKAAPGQRICRDCEKQFPQGFVPQRPTRYYLGVDASATSTDVVLITRSDDKDPDQLKVVESCKEPTTTDIITGIVKGVRHILGKAGVAPGAVSMVTVGTTQFSNALCERNAEQLAPVAVLRLGGAGVSSVAPFSTLPKDLQAIVGADYEVVNGGTDQEGREWAPLDVAAIKAFTRRICAKGVFNVVVNGVFSGVRADQEDEAACIVRSEASAILGAQRARAQLFITKASEVASDSCNDIILREHAGIVNASLRPFATQKVVAGLYSAFRSDALPMGNTKLFLTQSDGSLCDLVQAAKTPLFLLSAGSTNAMIGAVALCKATSLLPQGTQGTVTFNTLATALPLLRRSRYNATYEYDDTGFAINEVKLLLERIAVKIGKSMNMPTEEECRDLKALGFFERFAPSGNLSLDGFREFMVAALKCKVNSQELKQLFNVLDVGGTRAVVCDIGGSASTIGVVERSGFVRMQEEVSIVGGVRLNSRLPDVIQMRELGGASVIAMIEIPGTGRQTFEIGTKTVGQNLTSNRDGAKCFGGPHLTLTDLAVGLGTCNISGADVPRASKAFARLQDAKDCFEQVRRALENQVSLMKLDAPELPLVIVGGGSILFASDTKLRGMKEKVLKPEHGEVANAIGAVIAKISAQLPPTLVSAREYPPTATNSSAEIIETTFKRQLVLRCASNGAVADTVVVTEFSCVPVLYMEQEYYVVRGRAQGKVDVVRVAQMGGSEGELIELLQTVPPLEKMDDEGSYASNDRKKPMTESYLPATVVPEPHTRGGVWSLSPVDLECIALGAGVLASGGRGGSGQPRHSLWRALNAIIVKGGKEIRVISPKLLDRNRHIVFPISSVGRPDISSELIGNGGELGAALAQSATLCEKQIAGRQVVLMAGSAAGAAALEALAAAAQTGLPIVDADGMMGRSLPLLRHTMTFHVPGSALSPISMCGPLGKVTAVKETSFEKIEQQVQAQLVTKHAGVASLVLPPIEVDIFTEKGICFGSISLAWGIGRAICNARAQKQDAVKAAITAMGAGARVLFTGNIASVTPATGKRFAAGYLTVKTDSANSNDAVRIYYMNENITAQNAATGQYLATAPDLITVLDAGTGEGLLVDDYQFGIRVVVVVAPSHGAFRGGSLLHESSPKRLDKDLATEPVLLQPARGPVASICDH